MTAILIENMPAEDYHKDPALNFSSLKILREEPPERFNYERENKIDKPTEAMLVGRAIHCLVLEGEEAFEKEFAFKPYKGTLKKNDPERFLAEKAALVEFEANLGIKTALAWKNKEMFKGVANSIFKHHAKWLAQFDMREVSIFWDDPDFGCRCKARIDGIDSKTGDFMDLKTTGKTIGGFGRQALESDKEYPLQAGFYARAIMAGAKIRPRHFTWLVVEKEEPYITQRVTLPDEELPMIVNKIEMLAKKFSDCEKAQDWPSAAEDKLYIPEWWRNKGGREAT